MTKEELKTLKDIERWQGQYTEAKNEAIEWVKACIYTSCDEGNRCNGCQRIMKMNDITEGGLK